MKPVIFEGGFIKHFLDIVVFLMVFFRSNLGIILMI